MKTDEYLAFVDDIGRTVDGKYIYRFDFTVDKEIVWGEFFNVAPSALIPDLQPDKNTLSKSAKIIFPREMILAKKNYCFSMQDCIDGICPLIFSEIDSDTLEIDGHPFFIHFGENLETIEKMISDLGLSFFDITEVKKGNDSVIDDLINSIENNNDDDLDPDEF